MGEERKRLPRGLDELMEQNEDDLPFLSTYGPAEEEGEWAASIVGEGGMKERDGGTIFDALHRHLRALLTEDGDPELIASEDSIKCDGVLDLVEDESGSVIITIFSDHPLPLVPSDLSAPGMAGGDLSEGRRRASVTFEQWGMPSRRLIARIIEHHRLGEA